jgi:hypothetical protein
MSERQHKLSACEPLAPARRRFLARSGLALGTIALGKLFAAEPARAQDTQTHGGILQKLHFPPRARRVIYLFMSGGPSQLETFDYKPVLNERNGQELPASVRMGQRLTGMSGNQATLPMAGSVFKFGPHGQSGAWVSELFPHLARCVDQICFLKGLNGSNDAHGGA